MKRRHTSKEHSRLKELHNQLDRTLRTARSIRADIAATEVRNRERMIARSDDRSRSRRPRKS